MPYIEPVLFLSFVLLDGFYGGYGGKKKCKDRNRNGICDEDEIFPVEVDDGTDNIVEDDAEDDDDDGSELAPQVID